MLKKVLASLFILCCITWPAQYVKAVTVDWVGVFRDNIVYETGSFTGVTDQDTMKAFAELTLSSLENPVDYRVEFTGGPVVPPVYMQSYRYLGGTSWEYVNPPLPAPGSAWQDYTYNFQVVDASTLLPGTLPSASRNIPPGGYVTDPLNIPGSISFSGALLNPTISWNPVSWVNPESMVSNAVDRYRLRFYELNPDGSFNYAAIGFQTTSLFTNTFTLDATFGTLENGKSYAIGLQSIVNNPLGGGTLNRSQYYVRYDAVPEPAAMLLIGAGLLGLVVFSRRFSKKA